MEAALTIQAELQHRADEADTLRAAHVERARYHADLARPRYLAIDPAGWSPTPLTLTGTPRCALGQAQDGCDQARKHDGQLTDAQKPGSTSWSPTCPRSGTTPPPPPGNANALPSCCSPTSASPEPATPSPPTSACPAASTTPSPGRSRNGCPAPQNPTEAVTAIDELLDHHTHTEIADILNTRGLTSGEGRPFHRLIIRNIRDEYQLRSREQRLRDVGMLTLTETADRLSVSTGTVKTWQHAGLITGTRSTTKASASTPPPGQNPPARAQGRKRSKRRLASQPAPADDA